MTPDPATANITGFGVGFAMTGPASTMAEIRAAVEDRTALSPSLDEPQVTYEVRDADELTILRHDEVQVAHVGYAANPAEAADVISDDIHQQIAHRSERYLLIHAGAVAWNGVAVVVPGRSHSGKSTLTAAMVRAGAEYLSDEFAVLDRDGLVHPYPRKLSMRYGREDGRPVPVSDLGGVAADGPRALALIVSTRYEAGALWDPTVLTGSRALLPLIDNSVVAQTRSSHTMSTIAGLGDRVTTLIGLRGEAGGVVDELFDHAERLSDKPLTRDPPS